MKVIAVISDTHHNLDERLYKHLKDCDEIWHAGDIGSIDIIDELKKITKVRAVFGNIDNHILRSSLNEIELFKCEQVRVMITHIGGYPGRYAKGIKDRLIQYEPNLFICGHSHILKVMYDKKLKIMHMNPGAVGDYGIHKVKTILKFIIEGNEIKDLKVIEIPRK
ncbi:metallophosphatase family protein [Flavobacteriales bacterium]|nr:metallophosphatase family protein [Flavobacteriales bacterium]